MPDLARKVDVALESTSREVAGAMTVDTLPKPRSWVHVRTARSGTFRLVLVGPDGGQQAIAEVEVVVPEKKVAVISIRTSLALHDEPVVDKERPVG